MRTFHRTMRTTETIPWHQPTKEDPRLETFAVKDGHGRLVERWTVLGVRKAHNGRVVDFRIEEFIPL